MEDNRQKVIIEKVRTPESEVKQISSVYEGGRKTKNKDNKSDREQRSGRSGRRNREEEEQKKKEENDDQASNMKKLFKHDNLMDTQHLKAKTKEL